MEPLGRMLVFLGILIVVLGVVLMLAPRVPFIGRLPGDIVLRKGSVSFYFPIVTSILLSLVLTVLLDLFSRLFRG